MKCLISIAAWMSLLFAPMSYALHVDESINKVLLSVDCEGQLRIPLVESQFNLSEILLCALWDAKDLLLDSSLCDYMDKNCSSNFLFKARDQEVFSINAHLVHCPNKARPAVSIVCIGDACSKLIIPCETSNDCGPHLTCPREHSLATSSFISRLTSEVVSKILYPRDRPTNEWLFCGLASNISVTRSDQRLPENFETQLSSNVKQVGSTKSDVDNFPSNTTIFKLSCNGVVDLFGRRHFIGVFSRALHIIQALPLETFGFNSDFHYIHWIEYAADLPREELAQMVNIIGLNITSKRNQTREKWIVHSQAIDETLTIETNSCTTEDDAFVTVAVTRGLRDLLSITSCTQDIDCPSTICISIRDTVKNIREERGLRTLFLVDPSYTGICMPSIREKNVHSFNSKEFFKELLRILHKMKRPKYSEPNIEELKKRENELYRQMHQRAYIDPSIDSIPDVVVIFLVLLYLLGSAFIVILSVFLPVFISMLCVLLLLQCSTFVFCFIFERHQRRE